MCKEEVILSRIGPLRIKSNQKQILKLTLTDKALNEVATLTPLALEVSRQLDAYFAGEIRAFSLPFRLEGTPFQLKVWAALQTIPYGQTVTYGEIAKLIDLPKSYRAVGMACKKNPILIIIPCHRVLGKNNQLVGYAAGLKVKEILLDLEKTYS
ncbi:MAG: methylated-DNA--[Desulfovibrionaceae bacterium]|nr:methylated-DNA--[protein]-cysteine S-methyltransferase [Desulfovibrionaceae bacterium]